MDIFPWIDRPVSLYIVVCYFLTHNIWFVKINHRRRNCMPDNPNWVCRNNSWVRRIVNRNV